MSEDELVILVCGTLKGEKIMPDNLIGRCDVCDTPIEYRPHAPKNSIKRCASCALELFEQGDEITTTERMLEDAVTYLKNKRCQS